MNTYTKYCPNVYLAKCQNEHERGDIVTVTTRHGREIDNEIHNFIGKSKDGYYLYSVTRIDGMNNQTRAAAKSEKLEGYAANAEKRAMKHYEASQEGRDFLSLAEPIKVGHHSERRHRKLIERNWDRMGKSVAESEKAKEYERRAAYWKNKSEKIDLSMPDSLEYFEEELRKATEEHRKLKASPELRPHSMSLQYANKKVKELKDKVYTATLLWGDEEEIKLLKSEKEKEQISKATKKRGKEELIRRHGGFFAFNNKQFKEGYERVKAEGMLSENEKVVHVGFGLHIPKSKVESFLKEYKK